MDMHDKQRDLAPVTPRQESLGTFLREHLDEWLHSCLLRMRELPRDAVLTREQLIDCVPLFLEGITAKLDGTEPATLEKAHDSRTHALQRHALGVSVDQLVREYGLIAECATELCASLGRTVSSEEQLQLMRMLFTSAAAGVAEFAQREAARASQTERERTGFLAHEMRNPIASARLALDLIKHDSTKTELFLTALESSITLASQRVDDALSKLRIDALPRSSLQQAELVEIDALLRDVRADAALHAQAKSITVTVQLEPGLRIAGDHRALLSALSNLVRNAVKFTRHRGDVTIRARREEGRVLIEVHDECGGLPPEQAERVFEAFAQSGSDRTGFGLGLTIAQEVITASGGTLMVRNAPGRGCVFIADLPARP
jgi:signal transduction histidine kinase